MIGSTRTHPVGPDIIGDVGRQCPLPLLYVITVERHTNNPYAKQCWISVALPWLHDCGVSCQLRTCSVTLLHTHLCCTNVPQARMRDSDGGGFVVWTQTLAVVAKTNAMWCPSSTLNTFSFHIQDKILPQGKWIIICLHIGRYCIKSLRLDSKDLSCCCGACCLMYGHMTYCADSGRWKRCWSSLMRLKFKGLYFGVLWRQTL